MDEEQAVFQQLTLSYFKKWSATALQVQLSRLRQFLATESPLKIMKKCFLFDLIVLKIIKILSWIFAHVEKRLD